MLYDRSETRKTIHFASFFLTSVHYLILARTISRNEKNIMFKDQALGVTFKR